MLMPLVLLAQEEQHLKFKGVPIDGTLKEFTTKLVQRGFTKIGSENGQAVLTGDFAGFRDCLIYVSALQNKDLVNCVAAIFPSKSQWSILERDYNMLKTMLTKKYGEPSEVIEEFQTHSEPKSDDMKFHHLKNDECKYETTFQCENGDIILKMAHIGYDSCFIVLAYYDSINTKLATSSAIDDL